MHPGGLIELTTYKVFITDDEVLICNALEIVIQSQPDMEVVGVSHSGVDTLTQLEKIHPDLILMDVRMPIMDGIECIKKIKERYPDMLILILTTYNEESYIIDGLAHGANGYLLKGLDFPQLIATIRSTLNGQYILPAEVAAKLSHYLMNTKFASRDFHKLPTFITDNHSLTAREQDILLLLGNRLSIREIADELHISEGTIKNYLTIVYEKLNVSSRYEAIMLLRNK
jgi:DNA-binding NarL/FixJ family response regulator